MSNYAWLICLYIYSFIFKKYIMASLGFVIAGFFFYGKYKINLNLLEYHKSWFYKPVPVGVAAG